MIRDDEELRERGIEIGIRLTTVADRLLQTAKELQTLADALRTNRAEERQALVEEFRQYGQEETGHAAG